MNKVKICLDAGHGFKQNLGLKGYYESRGNLLACHALKKELEAFGFEVVMTRTEENQSPNINTQRGQVAIKQGCNVFISWHSDANAKASVRGVTVISSLQRAGSLELGQKLAAAVASTMQTPLSPYASSNKGVWTRALPNNKKADYYAVIREAVAGNSCVQHAFLIEHGFHTNPDDVAVLDSGAKRLELVKAEAKVLAEYFGMANEAAPIAPPQPILPTPPPAKDSMFFVQAGAWNTRIMAESYVKSLAAKGYKAIVKQDGGMYKVQAGAFASAQGAKAYAAKLAKAGIAVIVKKG